MMNTQNRIRDLVETLYAIELLEYHNKNHLYFGADPAKLSREKQQTGYRTRFAEMKGTLTAVLESRAISDTQKVSLAKDLLQALS